MIPKIINYCWFGNNKKSKKIQQNIATWKKFFPDYQLIEWNERNFDISSSIYCQQAYAESAYAFVSDYARMKILYEFGGIYFDTDVEVIRKFPNDVLENFAFAGIEDDSLLVSPGLAFGTVRHNPLIKKMLDVYDSELAFSVDSGTINVRLYNILQKDGFKKVDKLQYVDSLKIYPTDVFCGFDRKIGKERITKNTLTVHHYSGSWLPTHLRLKHELALIVRRVLRKR